jgi:hypothetical protein
VQKFSAYQDFRAAIHQYQREHQVSGIVWKQITCQLNNQSETLTYPEVDEELIALPTDLIRLNEAKPSIYEFWQQITNPMTLYHAPSGRQDYRVIAKEDVATHYDRAEWLSLEANLDANLKGMQVNLQLGWGQPREARYPHNRPEAGCEFIYALPPGYRPMPCNS